MIWCSLCFARRVVDSGWGDECAVVHGCFEQGTLCGTRGGSEVAKPAGSCEQSSVQLPRADWDPIPTPRCKSTVGNQLGSWEPKSGEYTAMWTRQTELKCVTPSTTSQPPTMPLPREGVLVTCSDPTAAPTVPPEVVSMFKVERAGTVQYTGQIEEYYTICAAPLLCYTTQADDSVRLSPLVSSPSVSQGYSIGHDYELDRVTIIKLAGPDSVWAAVVPPHFAAAHLFTATAIPAWPTRRWNSAHFFVLHRARARASKPVETT
ncbi:hypothetical protein FB451DRAFT_1171538 [Mycena latifolia]|nr:hypothetical protein FB451DRAFT_1171538 [Mycena latifolia]